MGFVEIAKYYDELFADAINPKTESPIDVTVYDSDGNQVYPHLAKDSPKVFDYYAALKENTSLNGHTRPLQQPEKQEGIYLLFPAGLLRFYSCLLCPEYRLFPSYIEEPYVDSAPCLQPYYHLLFCSGILKPEAGQTAHRNAPVPF